VHLGAFWIVTCLSFYADLGTSAEELVSSVPSRFILNAHKRKTPYPTTRHGLFSQWQNLGPQGSERPKPDGVLPHIFIES